jgi:hypothetical protein
MPNAIRINRPDHRESAQIVWLDRVSSTSNATSSQPERTEGCGSAPLGRTAAPVKQAVRIIAEAAIFWAGHLKQAGKIRNVELSAGIFCKEIESRRAKRLRKRGCYGRFAPTRFSLESASGHP